MRRIRDNIKEKEGTLETRMRWEASYSRKPQGFTENDRNVIWYLEEEKNLLPTFDTFLQTLPECKIILLHLPSVA